ncbi:hypothetical protein H4Q26_009251 [Puccinia striiformis f. sp. tritici PST-130]|nr:hypothetical protein H4Q26_009251 [Puccinia striiformis f. sp. tritici PST-130]
MALNATQNGKEGELDQFSVSWRFASKFVRFTVSNSTKHLEDAMADNAGHTTKTNIPMLTENNYLSWSMRMTAYLRHLSLLNRAQQAPGNGPFRRVSEKQTEPLSPPRNSAEEGAASALMHESTKSKKGKDAAQSRPDANREHTIQLPPHMTQHTATELHPELRPASWGPLSGNAAPATQLVEVGRRREEAHTRQCPTSPGSKPLFIISPTLFDQDLVNQQDRGDRV